MTESLSPVVPVPEKAHVAPSPATRSETAMARIVREVGRMADANEPIVVHRSEELSPPESTERVLRHAEAKNAGTKVEFNRVASDLITTLSAVLARTEDPVMKASLMEAREKATLAMALGQQGFNNTTEAIDVTREVAVENLVDTKTGLNVLPAAIEYASELFHDWLALEGVPLSHVQVLATDMMLFHAGNESLGTDGFDARIATVMQGLKGMSSYLATDSRVISGEADKVPFVEEKNPYAPLSAERLAAHRELKMYFPEGSDERAELEELRQAGVRIGTYRVNGGGGDEFMHFIIFRGEATAELRQRAVRLIDHVIKSTTLIPEQEIINGNMPRRLSEGEKHIADTRRQVMLAAFANYLNNLDTRHIPEYRRLADFKDCLRSYLRAGNRPGADRGMAALLADPQYEAKMDYAGLYLEGEPGPAAELPSLDDALYLFFEGADTYGRLHLDHEGKPMTGFYGADGEIDEHKLLSYAKDLYYRSVQKKEANDNGETRDVRSWAQEVMLKDISGNFLRLLNREVNGDAKKQAKVRRLIQACQGDPQAVFTVGSTLLSKRPFLDSLTDNDKVVILSELKTYYEGLFDHIPEQPTVLREPLLGFKLEMVARGLIGKEA